MVAADRSLTVAVSLDIPPYVMATATRGAEVDLMRRALPDYTLHWLQMDYDGLETAVSGKKADVAMSVQEHRKGVYYSVDYIGFANFAISRKSDQLKLKSVADLRGNPVLAWPGAWAELGDAFKAQYAPGSIQRPNYVEVADQAEQVRRFWQGLGKVIVIDRSIFDYFSRQMGHQSGEVEYHALFPKETRFKVGFADAAVRDNFNARLKELCRSGEYRELLHRYRVPDMAGMCDALSNTNPPGSRTTR